MHYFHFAFSRQAEFLGYKPNSKKNRDSKGPSPKNGSVLPLQITLLCFLNVFLLPRQPIIELPDSRNLMKKTPCVFWVFFCLHFAKLWKWFRVPKSLSWRSPFLILIPPSHFPESYSPYSTLPTPDSFVLQQTKIPMPSWVWTTETSASWKKRGPFCLPVPFILLIFSPSRRS